MSDNQQQNNSLTPFQRLPDDIKDAMSSIENAEINGKIADKYEITENKLPLMINIIGGVIMKEISLMDFPRSLKDALNLDVETTKDMALDIAIRRFLPLKNRLGDVENLIRKLGGEVPINIPLAQPVAKMSSPPLPPPPSFLRKDLRAILKDNKDTEEQLITSQPIRIEGFNGLVRPSLKNWLSDYIRLEGVGPHSLMVLTSYLYNSTNGKILSPKERKILGKILQSYSENTSLPVSEKNGLMVLEELEKEAAGAPPLPPTPLPPVTPVATKQSASRTTEQTSAPTNQPFLSNTKENPLQQTPPPERIYPEPTLPPTPTPSPAPLQPSRSSFAPPLREAPDRRSKAMENKSPRPRPFEPERQKQDGYLEPIDDLESGSPTPKTEARPGQPDTQPRPVEQHRDSTRPRLDGNIIDLKNFRER